MSSKFSLTLTLFRLCLFEIFPHLNAELVELLLAGGARGDGGLQVGLQSLDFRLVNLNKTISVVCLQIVLEKCPVLGSFGR